MTTQDPTGPTCVAHMHRHRMYVLSHTSKRLRLLLPLLPGSRSRRHWAGHGLAPPIQQHLLPPVPRLARYTGQHRTLVPNPTPRTYRCPPICHTQVSHEPSHASPYLSRSSVPRPPATHHLRTPGRKWSAVPTVPRSMVPQVFHVATSPRACCGSANVRGPCPASIGTTCRTGTVSLRAERLTA